MSNDDTPVEMPALDWITNRTFDELAVGERVDVERTLLPQDIQLFGLLAGDGGVEPSCSAHLSSAGQSLWAATLLAEVIGSRLPGPGTEYDQLKLKFLAPLRAGERLTVQIQVLTKDITTRQVRLACIGADAQGSRMFEGDLVVTVPTERIKRGRAALPGVRIEVPGNSGLTQLLRTVAPLPAIRVAVVHPCDEGSLSTVFDAQAVGLIEPVLVAPRERLDAVAAQAGIDLTGIAIEDVAHSHAAALRAAQLAARGEVEALMKGSLHTDELMAAIVASTSGLRTKRRISHCFVLQTPHYPKPFIVTDAAVNLAPTLEQKADIVRNAIELAHVIGVSDPRVAILAAVETVSPSMPATLDAAALCKMADRGQIQGGVLDGPLAFDNAVSIAAARTKGIDSPVAGQADILVVPDLESGNMLAKQLMYLGEAASAGIVLGAKVPVVLTSRSDSRESRITSCAIAVLLAHHYRNTPP